MVPFNSDGYISPGLHTYSYADFKKQFVDDFITSQSRSEIHNKCLEWLGLLSNAFTSIPEEVWFDGSFISEKTNPNDVDLVVFFDRNTFFQQHNVLETWNKVAHVGRQHYKCDAYPGIINNQNATWDDINMRNYWRGQFGFDRFDKPKGIIVLPWKELKSHIIKGESQ